MPTSYSSLRVKGALVLGGVAFGASLIGLTMNSGQKVLVSNTTIYSSGGLLPIQGTLSLSNIAGTGSGTQTIRNPYDKTLLCSAPTIRVTTAAAPATKADIYTSSGAVNSTGSGTDLMNDFNFGLAQTTTLSGGLAVSGLRRFVLAPYSTTTSASRINIKSRSGSGAGLAGSYYVPCYALD